MDGVKFDQDSNNATSGTGIISEKESSIKLVVLPTDEELIVAKLAYEFWKQQVRRMRKMKNTQTI